MARRTGKQKKKAWNAAKKKAIAAAAKRTEDPLSSWRRPQREECPICLVTMPIHADELTYNSCCGVLICVGCSVSQFLSSIEGDISEEEIFDKATVCPFCRSIPNEDDRSELEKALKLAKKGMPNAMCKIGQMTVGGTHVVKKDEAKGARWFHRAVEAGSPGARQ